MNKYDETQLVDEFDTNEEEVENQNETRNERFIRLAEGRVNKLVEMLRRIDNLSSNNYEYTEEQAQQIFDFIQSELDEVKGHFFKSEKAERKFKFK